MFDAIRRALGAKKPAQIVGEPTAHEGTGEFTEVRSQAEPLIHFLEIHNKGHPPRNASVTESSQMPLSAERAKRRLHDKVRGLTDAQASLYNLIRTMEDDGVRLEFSPGVESRLGEIRLVGERLDLNAKKLETMVDRPA